MCQMQLINFHKHLNTKQAVQAQALATTVYLRGQCRLVLCGPVLAASVVLHSTLESLRVETDQRGYSMHSSVSCQNRCFLHEPKWSHTQRLHTAYAKERRLLFCRPTLKPTGMTNSQHQQKVNNWKHIHYYVMFQFLHYQGHGQGLTSLIHCI